MANDILMPNNAYLYHCTKSFHIYLGQRKQWLSSRQILTHPFEHLSLVEQVRPRFCWQLDLFLPRGYSWVWWHHYQATAHPWPPRNAWPPPWSDAPRHALAKVQPVNIKNISLKRGSIKIMNFTVNIYFLIINFTSICSLLLAKGKLKDKALLCLSISPVSWLYTM